MILCRLYRFIFIKTEKTAGTSIELALRRYCGDGDIITPVTAGDEDLAQSLRLPGPQNYEKTRAQYNIRDHYLKIFRGKTPMAFYNHMAAAEIRARISEDIWQGSYKFCVERNPWDKVVSMFFWDVKPDKSLPEEQMQGLFRDYVRNGRFARAVRSYLYMIDGKVAVDRVLRYETLSAELDEVSAQLGLPGKIGEQLRQINAKGKFRPSSSRDYKNFYDEECKEIVAHHFSNEIALLGYQF